MNLLSYINSPSPITMHSYNDWKFYVKHDELCTTLTDFDTIKTRGMLHYGHQHRWTQGEHSIAVYNSQVSSVGVNLSEITAMTANKLRVYHRCLGNIPGADQIIANGGDIVSLDLPDSVVGKEAWLRAKYQANLDGYDMLPYGMAYLPAINRTAYECYLAMQSITAHSIVVTVGSGATLAGILKGLTLAQKQHKTRIFAVKIGSTVEVEDTINSFIASPFDSYNICWISCDRAYHERIDIAELPEGCLVNMWRCNPYYDRKALLWMLAYADMFKQPELHPVLFWNCG